MFVSRLVAKIFGHLKYSPHSDGFCYYCSMNPQPGFAIILNRIRYTDTLPFEVAPGVLFDHATQREAVEIELVDFVDAGAADAECHGMDDPGAVRHAALQSAAQHAG